MEPGDALVVIRANAGGQIGFGHLVRCMALADGFRRAGVDPIFITDGDYEILNRAGYRHVITSYFQNSGMDFLVDMKALQLEPMYQNSVLVVDSYAVDESYLEQARAFFKIRVVMDDLGVFNKGTDIILNGNVYGESLKYPEKGVLKLVGARYCLIRKMFEPLFRIKEIRLKVSDILVMMGGSDPQNLTSWITQCLVRKFPEFNYHIVIGEGFTGKAGLFGDTSRVSVYRNPENLAQIMASSDVAISAAGSTLYELAALGVPTLSITVAENQIRVAEGTASAGFAYSLGWFHTLTESRLLDTFEKIITSESLRSEMSRLGKLCIDGGGADRAASEILRNAELTGGPTK